MQTHRSKSTRLTRGQPNSVQGPRPHSPFSEKASSCDHILEMSTGDAFHIAPVCHVFHSDNSRRLPRTRPQQSDVIQPNRQQKCHRHDAATWNQKHQGRCCAQRQPFDAGSAEQCLNDDCSSDCHAMPSTKRRALQLTSVKHNRTSCFLGPFHVLGSDTAVQTQPLAASTLPSHTKIAFVQAATVSVTTPTTHAKLVSQGTHRM